MLRFVIGLIAVVNLVQAAPTVHLGESASDVYEYNTELPLIIDPIVVTSKPLVETSYVNPINMNYNPTSTAQQPAFQQPHQFPQQSPQSQPQQPQFQYYYYQPPQHVHPYNVHPYQAQPSFSYQWQDMVPQQYPIIQPAKTNVLPCTNPQHHGGYQQYGY